MPPASMAYLKRRHVGCSHDTFNLVHEVSEILCHFYFKKVDCELGVAAFIKFFVERKVAVVVAPSTRRAMFCHQVIPMSSMSRALIHI